MPMGGEWVHVVKDANVRTDLRAKKHGRNLKTSLPVQYRTS
jgi:hypothetical protein